MNAQDITIDLFTHNPRLKAGKIMLIICVITYILAMIMGGMGFLNEGFSNDNPAIIIPFVIFTGTSMVLFIAGIILFVQGRNWNKRITAFLEEYGEENLMNEIHNDTIYIYSRKNKPITIVTRKHIFEMGDNIYDATNLDYAYGYSYRGNTSVHVYTITNKLNICARGIYLRSDDIAQFFTALKVINPDMLIGFTHENNKAHRARVKEYKSANSL